MNDVVEKPKKKRIKMPAKPTGRAAFEGGVLPVVEQAKDVLTGERTTFDPVDASTNILDRLGANNAGRRLRGGTSTGAKPMLRRLFLTPDATFNHIAYTVEELCTLTGKTEVNIRTALTDLRSLKFCGSEGPLVTRMFKEKGLTFYVFDLDLTTAAQDAWGTKSCES